MRRDRDGSLLLDDDLEPVPVAAAQDVHACTDGWAGEDDHGRPTPCRTCRPHLPAAHRGARLTVVPPSAATLAMSEAAWQTMVTDYATLTGWRWHHQRLSKQSRPGWPDLCLVRGRRLIFAELKTERGTVRPEQTAWLDALRTVPSVEVFVWRPRHWATVQAVLAP